MEKLQLFQSSYCSGICEGAKRPVISIAGPPPLRLFSPGCCSRNALVWRREEDKPQRQLYFIFVLFFLHAIHIPEIRDGYLPFFSRASFWARHVVPSPPRRLLFHSLRVNGSFAQYAAPPSPPFATTLKC